KLLAGFSGRLDTSQEHWLSAPRAAKALTEERRRVGFLKHAVALAGKNGRPAPDDKASLLPRGVNFSRSSGAGAMKVTVIQYGCDDALSDRTAKSPLKRGGNITAHAVDVVVQADMSAEISNNKLFDQAAAESFLRRPRYGRTATFFPIQAQLSFPHIPRHALKPFNARQRAIFG